MKPIITNDIEEKHNEMFNKTLKNMFGDRIKQNFLIQIKEQVEKEIGENIFKYFDISFDMNTIVSGIDDTTVDYDICRMIVGCHRSNIIFLDDFKRSSMQQNKNYKKSLVNQVVEEIKLRKYSSIYFRKKQIILGDEFLFFPILYKLFAISVKAIALINLKSLQNKYYVNIFNKAIAAMTIIENNFMDSAYPLVRGIIEVYIKSVCINNKLIIEEINQFADWELEKTANGEYPTKFDDRYSQRYIKSKISKVDYLHYGWVDNIESYHELVKHNPYSIYGLFEYLKVKSDDNLNSEYDLLKNIYNRCHAFTHGSIGNNGYPLLHYFELSIALYLTITSTYKNLCNEINHETYIDEVDVLTSLHNDFVLLLKQYDIRSTENFKNYYKR